MSALSFVAFIYLRNSASFIDVISVGWCVPTFNLFQILFDRMCFFFFGVTSSEEFEKLGRLSVSLYGVTVALRNRDFQ